MLIYNPVPLNLWNISNKEAQNHSYRIALPCATIRYASDLLSTLQFPEKYFFKYFIFFHYTFLLQYSIIMFNPLEYEYCHTLSCTCSDYIEGEMWVLNVARALSVENILLNVIAFAILLGDYTFEYAKIWPLPAADICHNLKSLFKQQ